MSNAVQKYIEELEVEQRQLLETKEDVEATKAEIAGEKAEVSLAAVGRLLKVVKQSFDDFIECQAMTKHFDPNLGEMLSRAIRDLLQIQARIEFNPVINVDIRPVANQIKEQNSCIIDLLTKMTDQAMQVNDPLYQIIKAMVERNNAFIEKQVQQFDYTEELQNIARSMPKRITEWDIIGTREPNGQIRITATAKKTD